LMLALRRNLLAYRRDVEAGEWQHSKQFCLLTHPLQDLRGSTLGIIGFGAIGRAMTKLGESVGMRSLISERRHAAKIRDSRTSFQDVLKQSDIVSLHAPLTPETRAMFGRAEFALMKPGALFINTARGGLVEDA